MTRTIGETADVGEETPLRTSSGYAPIGAYAAIGDGRTLALVASDGAIDWLPLPTIDQDAAFAAILDARRGGSFLLAPEGEHHVERRYVEDTPVLETTFTAADGTVVVTDALTLQDGGLLPWVELVRRVRCTAGRVRLSWSVEPRFGFGREHTRFVRLAGAPVALGDRLRLAVLLWDAGDAKLEEARVSGTFELAEGETALLACVATDNEPIPYPPREEIETRLERTCASWRRWLERAEYDGPWHAAVRRSALTLKLLTYAPSGAQTAAGTTGLPERVGGSRNFDYRFCWIRDTSFALDALSRLGYREQVHASLSWLLDVSDATHPRLEPFYGLGGHVPRGVTKLDLEGYRGSQPVQIGNSAATQLQLGNFGDLFETLSRYVRHGNAIDPTTGMRLAEIADFVCRIWRNDDSGFWELGTCRSYTSSKMACWLALARAAELARDGHVPPDGVERWTSVADEIRDYVETACWSEAKGSYAFYAGSDDLDCSVLRASLFGFADPRSDRMNTTIDALRRELGAGGPLVYRYTGMESEEGCFLACSFWLVTALAKADRLDEARTLLDDLVELANDVGLYAEEMAPGTREQLGNFPQALTHLALIQAAFAIQDAEHEDGGAA